jgi:large subunit ribosomal protein L21
MHAIIETGGKQYRVAPGETLRVEKLNGDVGSEIELRVKAAFNDAGELISVAPVKATITGNGRGEKIIVFKFKRKKQYKKTIGHRQSYTEVKVGSIGDQAAGKTQA